MRISMKKCFQIIAGLLLIINSNSHSQSLNANLSRVAGEYAKNYIQPLVNAFGSDINSGLINITNTTENEFHIYLGVRAFGSFIPDADKLFSAVYNENVIFTDQQGNQYPTSALVTVTNAPTIFGDKTPGISQVNINGVFNGQQVNQTFDQVAIGGLWTTSIAPLAVPQLEIGNLFGTEFLVRWIPPIKIQNLGSTGFWGFGVKHRLSRYFNELPVDITAQFVYQKFYMNDSTGNSFITSNSEAFNLVVSKDLGIISFYGGVQYENVNFDVNYSITPAPTQNDPNPAPFNISFSSQSKSNFRAVLGTSLNLLVFNLYIDYSFSGYNVVSGGLGLRF
jgi:hypothetical protein